MGGGHEPGGRGRPCWFSETESPVSSLPSSGQTRAEGLNSGGPTATMGEGRARCQGGAAQGGVGPQFTPEFPQSWQCPWHHQAL